MKDPTAKSETLLELSVIIPVFDEPESILQVVAEVAAVVKRITDLYEIIVVDDASPEPVAAKLKGYEKVRVLREKTRGGSGSARKTGFASARGEWMLWIDGDGTYPPEGILHLWDKRQQADQVIGARNKDFGRLALLRFSLKRLVCHRASRRWKRAIPDLNSGLRLFRVAAAQVWMHALPDGFSCCTTATLAALKHQQRVTFVAISYQPRRKGSRSKFLPFKDTLRFIRTVERWKPPA